MASIARSLVLVTIAFCFTQVLAQYEPTCQTKTVYVLDADGEFSSWAEGLSDYMIATSKISFLDVANLGAGYFYTADQYTYTGGIPFAVFSLNMVLEDIPTRNIKEGKIQLFVSMDVGSLTSGDPPSALVAAANRLKDQYNVEIFLVDDNTNPTFLDQFTYKIAQDIASNPVEGHVFFLQTLNVGVALQYFLGVNSYSCASLGGLYFYTFDGASYDFNGLGEYLLLSGDYITQVRLAPCDYSNPSSRTCLRAIALKSEDSGEIIEVHYDPVAEYISVYYQGDIQEPSERTIHGTNYYYGEYSVSIAKIQTPLNADPIYEVVISTAILTTQYVFFMGQRMGLSMYVELDMQNIGLTTGLCGTWDGCLANEFYSQNQTYTPIGASPSDIYYNFAESWRVSEANSLFTHGVNAQYYMPGYGSYSPQWKPAFSGVLPTATAANDCSFFQNISPFLYTACLDEVSKGNSDIRTIAYLLVASACAEVCENGYSSASFVSASYCASTCPRANVLDFHDVYNSTNIPPFTMYPTSVAATFTATLGGTYTYALTSEFCPDSMVTGTVQITCDQPPTVNAGDDVVVKKDELLGWPVLALVGTASDENSPALEVSWELISHPMGVNYTAGSWQPYPPVGGPVPLLFQEQTLSALVLVQFPGDYVFELSVFDGCYLATDQITVHAVCAGCQLHVEASGIADQTYESLGTSDAYTPSTSSSGANTFNYVWTDSNADPHWFIDSNSRGYSFEYPEPDNVDVYDFVVIPPEIIINTTVIGEVFVTDNETSSDGSINTATILRYEGQGHWKREITTNTTKITTTTTYSSVPIPVTKCRISISNADDFVATFQIIEDADANVSRPFTQQPACIGDYTVRVAVRDECQSAYDVTNFHVGCSQQPQAHLITCPTSIKYDYNGRTFPSITFDGKDTYDPDTPPANLLYQWEVNSPFGVGYFSTDCSSQVTGTDAYVNCPTNTYTANDGPGTYTITMWVSDGCTYDYESTSFVAECDPLSATAQAMSVDQDLASPANGIANLTASFVSDHPANVEFYWRLVIAPQGYDELLNLPTNEMFTANTTADVYLGGSYTYELDVYDGCRDVLQNVSFTYTCATSMSFGLSADLSSVAFPAGHSFPTSTITIDMNTTVNTASGRAYYKYSLVEKPSGSSVFVSQDWTSYNGGANPTIPIDADLVGDYVVQVWVSDSCNYATKNITISATCNALTPTINGASSLYTIPSLGSVTVTGLYIEDAFVNYTVYWELVDAFNNSFAIANGPGVTTAAVTLDTSGAYQIVVTAETGLPGCYAMNSASLTATCNFTLGINAPTGSVSSTFTRGKFSRVSVSPSFSGVDSGFEPMINFLTDYTWTFTQAPSGSVFEPTRTVSYTSKNTSSITDYVYDADTEVWTKTQVDSVEWTTIIDTKYVTLNYDNSYYDGCFSPDLPGTYTLEFSIYDYCGKQLTQSYTVTAGCNQPPTASAGAAATYSFEGTGFSSGSYMYTAIPINGSASDPENDFLRYQWSVVSQPNNNTDSITINNEHSRLATFVPTVAGVYTLQLSVTDGCSITNSTVDITVACPNTYQVNAPISFTFDGFTPVALQEFSLLANPQCTRAWMWSVVDYDPSTAIPPVTATGGEVPKSGANYLAIPSMLIAFLAMIVKML